MDFCVKTVKYLEKTSAKTYDTMQYLRDRYGQETSLSMCAEQISFQSFNLVYPEGIFNYRDFVIPRDGDDSRK